MGEVLPIWIFSFLTLYFICSLILFLRRAGMRRTLRSKYPIGFSFGGDVYFSAGNSNAEPELGAEDWDIFVGSRARPCGAYDAEGVFTPIIYDWRIGNPPPGGKYS